MEAVKQTFAVKPKGVRVRARVTKPILVPAPGAAPVSQAPISRAPLGRRRRKP